MAAEATVAAQSSIDHFFAPPVSSLLATDAARAIGADNTSSMAETATEKALDEGMHATSATLWADDVATTKTIGAFADVLAVFCLFALLSRTYVHSHIHLSLSLSLSMCSVSVVFWSIHVFKKKTLQQQSV